MTTIEGVIASVRSGSGHSVLTVFPIEMLPEPSLRPDRAIDLRLAREAWQTEQSHIEHVRHIVGLRGVIEYDDDRLIAAISH